MVVVTVKGFLRSLVFLPVYENVCCCFYRSGVTCLRPYGLTGVILMWEDDDDGMKMADLLSGCSLFKIEDLLDLEDRKSCFNYSLFWSLEMLQRGGAGKCFLCGV